MNRRLLPTLALAVAPLITHAAPPVLDLAGRMGAYNNMRSLNALTESEETMNRVELLHLGHNSLRERRRLISEAQHHIFMTIPYWFDDEIGNETIARIKTRKHELQHQGKRLDFRVLTDWVSPASSGDFWGNKQFARLDEATDGKMLEWNPFWRLRPWSQEISNNRMHDKIMVVDGKTMIMGGMNVADEYLLGGISRKGWHDTDILIEGPAAQEGSKYFLKPYLLQSMLEQGVDFPYDDRFQLAILRSVFNFENYSYEYPIDGAFRAFFRRTFTLPIQGFLDDPRYFPPVPWRNTYTKPVRLIWDQPLVDRKPVTHEHFSKLFNVMDFILQDTRQSIKIFLPYPTFSERMVQYLLRARQKGLRVQLVTNSMISHDLGRIPYLAGLVNYERLLQAGVEIHEWQGHKPLEAFEREHGCTIDDYWPGFTLHTKAVIFDDSITILGSHNFNYRSEKMNSEIMALIRDTGFSRQLAEVLRYDLDLIEDQPTGKRTVRCGGVELEGRPARTLPMTLEKYRELKKKHGVTSKLLDKFKWVF